MHKESPKPKWRVTEKLYSQLVDPIYIWSSMGNVLIISMIKWGNMYICTMWMIPLAHSSLPWETWCMRNEEHATCEMNWCVNTKKNTHTTLTHTSLLYVHRVSSLRSLGILLNAQMLCLNKVQLNWLNLQSFYFKSCKP